MGAKALEMFEVRIRFAGLCTFIAGRRRVHVLLPRTSGSHTHTARLHWRKDPSTGASVALPSSPAPPVFGAWDNSPARLPTGLFHLQDYPSRCVRLIRGRVLMSLVNPHARMRLHTGYGEIINAGALWTLPGDPANTPAHPMPTVVDWWLPPVDADTLARELRQWGVVVAHPRDASWQYPPRPHPVVDLWVLHVLPDQQQPGKITNMPLPPTSNQNHHFTFHLDLLACNGTQGPPQYAGIVNPIPPDSYRPWWPGGRLTPIGMMVDCGVAQATPVGP